MPPLIEITSGDVRWWVLPDCRDQLFGAEGLRLDEWLRTGQARVAKQGPHRMVYRIELPGLKCYLKHNLLPNVRAWLRQLVRPSKARTEYQRALAVASRHLPTVVPLAVGERRAGLGPKDSFLITRSLEGTVPLDFFVERVLPGFPPARQARVRHSLAVALGQLLARIHEAGVVHNDLHCGNLLLHLDPHARPSLYLIDLHAVRLGRPLGWRASRANLVILNRWFVVRAFRTDRLRFWRAYCRMRHADSLQGPTGGERARDLEQRTRLSNERFWRRRERRCRQVNRYYHPVRSAGVVGHAVTDLDHAALAALLADPDEPFRRPGVTLLKDSRSSTVAEFDFLVGGQAQRVIYKRFRVTAWSDPWVSRVRPPAALRSWVQGHSLRERSLPTPRPLAVLHRQRCGLYYEGYLLMEEVPHAVDLHHFVASLPALGDDGCRANLRRRIAQLAWLIRELHGRHLSHRDLKAGNVLFKDCGPETENRPADPGLGQLRPNARPPSPDPLSPFWLIDLVGVTRHRKLGRQRRVQNLARLHASFFQDPLLTRTDKLRFLRVYLQWGLFGRHGWKPWWRKIERATLAKVARNLRSGRPLG